MIGVVSISARQASNHNRIYTNLEGFSQGEVGRWKPIDVEQVTSRNRNIQFLADGFEDVIAIHVDALRIVGGVLEGVCRES
jgi:hypothetical protein